MRVYLETEVISREEVYEVLSCLPPQDLEELKSIKIVDGLIDEETHCRGEYQRWNQRIVISVAATRNSVGEDGDIFFEIISSLLHEMGHHVDSKSPGFWTQVENYDGGADLDYRDPEFSIYTDSVAELSSLWAYKEIEEHAHRYEEKHIEVIRTVLPRPPQRRIEEFLS